MDYIWTSQSPRRTELLTQVGIEHTVVSSSYEEDNVVITDPIEMVKAQALGKARCAEGGTRRWYHFRGGYDCGM